MPFFQPDVMADMTTRQQSEWLLEMIDVSKSFPGVKALDNVNLRVRPHSVHALMGENGAGKSTLLKCLFGIYEKDEGKIFFKGQEINFTSSKEALENGVSMVHQELNLVLQRTVMDNMWLGRYPTKGWFVDHGKMYDDTKRIFDDPVGRRCGAHSQPFLIQTYRRDTGEVVHDISAPIFVGGRQWGGFRIGYAA